MRRRLDVAVDRTDHGGIVRSVGTRAHRPRIRQSWRPGFQMYKGNPGRTGELLGPGPAEPVQALWTVETAGPIKSSPAVAGDEMFIVSGDSHVVAPRHSDRGAALVHRRRAATSGP